ncbi:MAG: tripartite tricarboxylate transporter substrate binding protein [Pseudomonadota bacterium]
MKAFNAVVPMLLAGVLIGLAGPVAAQQAYPSKPIRFITPYPPGGSTTPMARIVGQKLGERWGQQVIIDNRGGGNTVIGTEIVAKAPPDGYTILLISSAFLSTPSLLPFLPYDPVRDFDAVATISTSRFVLVVHPSVPANTLQEFISLAKSQPGKLNYGSSGVGANTHLSAELFDLMVGTKMQHIPYKGSGPLVSDLIGGQVQISFQVPISVISHIKSGRLKTIAITGETRVSALPQVPTFAEAGLPGYGLAGWFGIAAPAGTPKDIINKMSSEVVAILGTPDVQKFLANQGSEAFISTPEQTAALIKEGIAKYARIIKAANIKVEK